MNSLAFASIVVAILAVANAHPGGLTGVPLISQSFVPKTIISEPKTILGPAPIIVSAPIKTTIYKAEPSLLVPSVKGLVGKAPVIIPAPIKTTVYKVGPSVLVPSVKGLVGPAPIKSTIVGPRYEILAPGPKGLVGPAPIGLKGINSGIWGAPIWV